MEVVKRGLVFAGKRETNYQSCAFPTICVLPSGRWVCGFRGAPTKQSTLWQGAFLCWSDDEGDSWSEPISPFIPPVLEGKEGLFRSVCLTSLGGETLLAALYWVDHSIPGRPFFNEETEGLLESDIFFSTSTDGGETWNEPMMMDTSPFHVPTPLTGSVLLFPDGELCCQFELNKHYDDEKEWYHAAVLMFSSDGGKTWPYYTFSGDDPKNKIFYWDQRVSLMDDKTLFCLFWTYDRVRNDYLNIQARESLDRGRTWSSYWDTGVPGQPAQAVPLSNKRRAMVYVDRTTTPVIKARMSDDGGKSFFHEIEISEQLPSSQLIKKTSMQEAWQEMGAYSLGLPATAKLEDDFFLVVYYQGSHMDETDIRWAMIKA